MPRVELIYDRHCPNVEAARAALLSAFDMAGMPPRWREWDRESPDSPPYVRGYGSPSLLVEGRDVDGAASGAADCCRVYRDAGGALKGVPAAEHIAARLREAGCAPRRSEGGVPSKQRTARWWRAGMGVLPAAGMALLPKLTCPACWPAYAAIASAMGMGYFNHTPYLFPLTLVFLGAALFALAYRAPRRRGYGPLGLGLAAALAIVAAKFALDSRPLLYGGVGLLMAASLWNAWPRRRTGAVPACGCGSGAEEGCAIG